MGRIVRLRISGRGDGTDAPTVEDALDQLRDYLELLKGVEEALADIEPDQIVWRIINASRSSPLAFEIEAFPREHALNVDRRVRNVLFEAARGLSSLLDRPERPAYFTNKVMGRAQRIFQRVNDGLGSSEAEFGDDLPRISPTPTQARTAARNAELVLRPVDRPYKELGSVEGRFQGAEVDGFGRRIAFVRERITGETIKCLVAGSALPEIGAHPINEIWLNRRVQASGRISYRARGKITQIEEARFRFFPPATELPQVDQVIDRDFTSGLSSEDFLERVRNGSPS